MSLHPRSRELRESTRGQVLGLLRGGPASVEELARELGVTRNAVRFHLRTLERNTLVRPAGVRRTAGAGKPTTLYQIAPEAEASFSSAYLPLARALLAGADASLGRKERNRLFRSVASQLKADASVMSGPWSDQPAARAAALMDRLGAVAQVATKDGGITIQGRACPLSAVVTQHPEVCRALRDLLAHILGAEVQEECQRGARPQCRFVATVRPHRR